MTEPHTGAGHAIIFTMPATVHEQLGLRLRSQRGAVDVLKIDTVDKVPTEN